jgi:hypothetical protein
LLGHDQGSLTFGFNGKIRTFFGRNVYQMSATVSDPKALVVPCTSISETTLGLVYLHVAWVDYVACWRAGQTTVSGQVGLARQVVCKEANSRPDCIKFGIRPKSKERHMGDMANLYLGIIALLNMVEEERHRVFL